MPRKVRVPPAPQDEGGGELNVVPFLDIIMNVLMFVLATLAVTFTTRLDASPPERDARGPHADVLGLDVAVLHEGFLVSARGQRVGQGCDGPGPGLAGRVINCRGGPRPERRPFGWSAEPSRSGTTCRRR